jgi:hypothetical protein
VDLPYPVWNRFKRQSCTCLCESRTEPPWKYIIPYILVDMNWPLLPPSSSHLRIILVLSSYSFTKSVPLSVIQVHLIIIIISLIIMKRLLFLLYCSSNFTTELSSSSLYCSSAHHRHSFLAIIIISRHYHTSSFHRLAPISHYHHFIVLVACSSSSSLSPLFPSYFIIKLSLSYYLYTV